MYGYTVNFQYIEIFLYRNNIWCLQLSCLGRSASKLMKVKGQGVKGVSSLDIELCEGNAPWDRPSKSAMTSKIRINQKS
jgi:hypothetical protein